MYQNSINCGRVAIQIKPEHIILLDEQRKFPPRAHKETRSVPARPDDSLQPLQRCSRRLAPLLCPQPCHSTSCLQPSGPGDAQRCSHRAEKQSLTNKLQPRASSQAAHSASPQAQRSHVVLSADPLPKAATAALNAAMCHSPSPVLAPLGESLL